MGSKKKNKMYGPLSLGKDIFDDDDCREGDLLEIALDGAGYPDTEKCCFEKYDMERFSCRVKSRIGGDVVAETEKGEKRLKMLPSTIQLGNDFRISAGAEIVMITGKKKEGPEYIMAAYGREHREFEDDGNPVHLVKKLRAIRNAGRMLQGRGLETLVRHHLLLNSAEGLIETLSGFEVMLRSQEGPMLFYRYNYYDAGEDFYEPPLRKPVKLLYVDFEGYRFIMALETGALLKLLKKRKMSMLDELTLVQFYDSLTPGNRAFIDCVAEKKPLTENASVPWKRNRLNDFYRLIKDALPELYSAEITDFVESMIGPDAAGSSERNTLRATLLMTLMAPSRTGMPLIPEIVIPELEEEFGTGSVNFRELADRLYESEGQDVTIVSIGDSAWARGISRVISGITEGFLEKLNLGTNDCASIIGSDSVYDGSHEGRLARIFSQHRSRKGVVLLKGIEALDNVGKDKTLSALSGIVNDHILEDPFLGPVQVPIHETVFVIDAPSEEAVPRELLGNAIIVRWEAMSSEEKTAAVRKKILPLCSLKYSDEVLAEITENYAWDQTTEVFADCIEAVEAAFSDMPPREDFQNSLLYSPGPRLSCSSTQEPVPAGINSDQLSPQPGPEDVRRILSLRFPDIPAEMYVHRHRREYGPQVLDKINGLLKLRKLHLSESERAACSRQLDRWKELYPHPCSGFDLDSAKKIFGEIYGLEEVKDRVISHLYSSFRNGGVSGLKLGLAGPPGTGKTRLCRCIAGACGLPMGIIHCNHLGSQGQFTEELMDQLMAFGNRMLIVLDEFDKLSPGAWGPLYSILDGEKASINYEGTEVSLKEVSWLLTANCPQALDPVILDRIELVEIKGYRRSEKRIIAREFMLKSLSEEYGLKIGLPEENLGNLLAHDNSCGMRFMEKSLRRAIEKAIIKQQPEAGSRLLLYSEDFEGAPGSHDYGKMPDVNSDCGDLKDENYAGINTADEDNGEFQVSGKNFTEIHVPGAVNNSETLTGPGKLKPGVPGAVNLLAVTGYCSCGARAESRVFPGKPDFQVVTGLASESVTDSVRIAKTLLETDFGFEPFGFHVNLAPAGFTKDGPSAGLAIFLSLYSSLTGKPLPEDLYVTGALSLSGRIEAVGGITEKADYGTLRGTVILPGENRCELEACEYGDRLVFVSTAAEAVKYIFG